MTAQTGTTPNIEAPPLSRGEARKRAMMDAAWESVMEKGLAATTLDDIITRSGGSKATLYNAFGDKDGLLKAVLWEKINEFAAELTLTLNTEQPPDKTLYQFADTMAMKICDPEAIRFIYLLMTEGHQFPTLLQSFEDEATCQTDEMLSHYIATAATAGKLLADDPHQSAEFLMSMIKGHWMEPLFAHALSGDRLADYQDNVRRRARAAVDLFLRAHRP